MIKDVYICNYIETEKTYTENELFVFLCNMFNDTPIKNIYLLLCVIHIIKQINELKRVMEDANNEGRDNELEYESYIDNILSTNDSNVSLLKYIMLLIFTKLMSIVLILMMVNIMMNTTMKMNLSYS
jgi:hypothetical protein